MTQFLEFYNEFDLINQEFIIAVFALYYIGCLIKKSNINNAYIPFLLILISFVFNFIKQSTNIGFENIQIISLFIKCFELSCFETMATVYINQLIKQKNKK